MQWWAKSCCFILGIHITITGASDKHSAYFVVSNHCSYLDILVIGSILPSAFISKKEVASWPLLGLLAQFGGTIFIDRESKAASVKSFQEIKNRLNSGISVIVFPEGTTNNGVTMRNFKSTFFKIPLEANTPVLPISLMYSHIDRELVTPDTIDTVAWHGDMELLPHLWNVLGRKRIDMRIHFNPVFNNSTKDRKELSLKAFETIKSGCVALQRDIQI